MKAYLEGENNIPKPVLARRKNQSRLLFVFLVLLGEAKTRGQWRKRVRPSWLISSHIDEDEFGTVGDLKTSESFTSLRGRVLSAETRWETNRQDGERQFQTRNYFSFRLLRVERFRIFILHFVQYFCQQSIETRTENIDLEIIHSEDQKKFVRQKKRRKFDHEFCYFQ